MGSSPIIHPRLREFNFELSFLFIRNGFFNGTRSLSAGAAEGREGGSPIIHPGLRGFNFEPSFLLVKSVS
ncbi:MAG: hypothetical protein CVU00_05790 [Bacteroidetes bacterium HGW-Bacteroidetes-17]|nr:MAG: hypothetical protein CVU00_05790 [Bacteroidetes bacterium HGW-Bacteroidetes-17]